MPILLLSRQALGDNHLPYFVPVGKDVVFVISINSLITMTYQYQNREVSKA